MKIIYCMEFVTSYLSWLTPYSLNLYMNKMRARHCLAHSLMRVRVRVFMCSLPYCL